ncbi:MAG: GMC oxidoreductase, partial [Natronospirillum sp.]
MGGTSRRWAGYLARLHDGNFNHALDHARWPISQADLLPHYQQALVFFGRKTEVVTHHQWPLLDGKMALRPISRGAPMRITTLETFTRSPNVEIQTGHHVVRLESADRQRVDHILIKPDEGDLFRLKILPGQQVVLACGGLGNAQVLMQPQDTTTTGVGNESGYAGKCLMEHPHATCGAVFLTKQFHDRLTRQTESKGLGQFLTAFALSDRVRRSESLFDCTLTLHMRPQKNNQGLQFSQVWGTNVVAGTVIALAEQEPVETNAVQLLNERNRAGLLRLRTECVLTGRDLRSIYDSARTLGEWLATHNVGAFKFHNDGIFREARGGGHTMGTTRMGISPKNSVCDRNARVHGYSNLHLAGSSLF